jgi:serine/threonine protein kinase
MSVFNATLSQWSSPRSLPAPLVDRRDACVIPYRTQLFVIGGVHSSNNSALGDVWVAARPADADTTWRPLTRLPAGLAKVQCVVFDNVAVVFDIASGLLGMLVLATGQWSSALAPPPALATRQPPLAHAALLRRDDDVLLVGSDTAGRLAGWRCVMRDREWSELDVLATERFAGAFGAVRSAVVTPDGVAVVATSNASSSLAAVVVCDCAERLQPPVSVATSALADTKVASAAADAVTNTIVLVTERGDTVLWHAGVCESDCAAHGAKCTAGACRCPSGEFREQCATADVGTTVVGGNGALSHPSVSGAAVENEEAVQIGVSIAVAVVCIALMACVAVAAVFQLRRMLKAAEAAAAAAASPASSSRASDREDGGVASMAVAPSKYVIERLDSQAVTANSFAVRLSPASLRFVAEGDESSEIAVDVPVTTQITLSADKALSFRFAPVVSSKFELVLEPSVGALKPNVPQVVTARLTPLCTTVIDVSVALYATSNNALENQQLASANAISSKKTQIAGLKHVMVPIEATSALSTKLDYDQLGLLRVAPSRGSVSSANDNHLLMGTWNGQVVAVKLLRIQRFDDVKIEQAFFTEIALLSKLKHRTVVPVFGASAQPGKLAVVTEYIEGGCVTSYIGEGAASSLTRKVKLKVMLDTAEAIGFLHRCDILHRNVKPNNVLVVSTDVFAAVNAKVTDFGSCRSLTDRVAMAHRVGIGRPVYTAPEILCLQPYSTSSDVYSFGGLVMFLLTEVEPFSEIASHWEVVEAIVAGTRPRIDGGAIGDPALVALIRDCWKPTPAERPDMRTVVQVCRVSHLLFIFWLVGFGWLCLFARVQSRWDGHSDAISTEDIRRFIPKRLLVGPRFLFVIN